MTIEITPAEAASNIFRHIGARTLKQGVWPEKGQDIACLLGSIHNEIYNPSRCPTNLMPLWLSEYTVVGFDGLAKADIYDIATRYATLVASGQMARADDALMRRWLIIVVKDAVASAKPLSIELACWGQVQDACNRVIEALDSNKDPKEAVEAAAKAVKAVEAAMKAVEAAAKAVKAATEGAWTTESMARAAQSAAWAALWAMSWAELGATVVVTTVKVATWVAAEAAEAAAAAHKRLFSALLDEIEKL